MCAYVQVYTCAHVRAYVCVCVHVVWECVRCVWCVCMCMCVLSCGVLVSDVWLCVCVITERGEERL